MTTDAVFETHLKGLPLIHRGKVRDLYALDDELMLIVATDRLSAFDVVMPDPIPEKGRVLTQLSNFWFARTGHIVPNHVSDAPVSRFVRDPKERKLLRHRSVVVRRLNALPIEAVVRGYLIGSGWKDYEKTGKVCGIRLPAGLRLAAKLPEPIFTPATKAQSGEHDENIPFAQVEKLLGAELAERVRRTALALYEFAAKYALTRGIIIADTKFEFGLDAHDRLVLIDEVLTPDSSRFWPVDGYAPGASPPSFDKQYVRDWLESVGWPKKPPAPHLPPEVVARTSEKYLEALRLLTED